MSVFMGCSPSGGQSHRGSASPVPVGVVPPQPVLGSSILYRDGVGWGSVAPTRIALGHTAARYWLIHPSLGVINKLHWHGWGAPTAYGSGQTAARRRVGGLFARKVKIQVRVHAIGACAGHIAYTHMRVRIAPRPGAVPAGRWVGWPMHAWADDGLCSHVWAPRPYLKPAKNELGVYYRGDNWNWRTDKACVGPGKRLESAGFALQYLSRYFPSAVHHDIRFGLRDYSDHTPLIARGTAVPLRVVVADPAGHVAWATVSLTHYGLATASYPEDFSRSSGVGPVSLRRRPLLPGTYTMLVETVAGAQLVCSGAFVRSD
jgi:hypothetical protein